MSEILRVYNALSSASPRSDVAAVFNSVIYATPFTFDKNSRVELIKAIIQDLKSCGSKGRLNYKDAAQALLAVKSLGKDPAGSQCLSEAPTLLTLLGFATTFKDDLDASSEALRSIANALLLIEEARSTFISKGVNGGDACILMLENSTSPEHIFILSRILFLSTASGTTYIETIVEGKHHGRTLVDILGSKLDLMTAAVCNGAPTSNEAMSDLLKFIFNILLHYPKLVGTEPQNSYTGSENIMGDFWNSKLEPFLPPLLRVFHNLPPTSPCPILPPLTHVIHSLITIPITPALKPTWLGQPSPASSIHNSTTDSPKNGTPGRSRSDSPTRSTQAPTPLKPSTLDRALSRLAPGRRSSSSTPASPTSTSTDLLKRLMDLLASSFSHFFPGNVDPDDPTVRQRCKAESNESLDDMLSPLAVLISKICLADEGSRARIRQIIVPDDLDRSVSLETRPDLLGRCLRLLACVHHPGLKDAVGEMLFAVADSDASTLSMLFGYGNVAGFLFHKGVFSAPQASSSSNGPPSADEINPITGTTFQPKSALPDMSDEEKEREMEKLFGLFDRLEKMGAINPEQNPMRKAIQRGQLD